MGSRGKLAKIPGVLYPLNNLDPFSVHQQPVSNLRFMRNIHNVHNIHDAHSKCVKRKILTHVAFVDLRLEKRDVPGATELVDSPLTLSRE